MEGVYGEESLAWVGPGGTAWSHQHENPSYLAAVNPKRLGAAAIAFLLVLLFIQIRQSRSCTATGGFCKRPAQIPRPSAFALILYDSRLRQRGLDGVVPLFPHST